MCSYVSHLVFALDVMEVYQNQISDGQECDDLKKNPSQLLSNINKQQQKKRMCSTRNFSFNQFWNYHRKEMTS